MLPKGRKSVEWNNRVEGRTKSVLYVALNVSMTGHRGFSLPVMVHPQGYHTVSCLFLTCYILSINESSRNEWGMTGEFNICLFFNYYDYYYY